MCGGHGPLGHVCLRLWVMPEIFSFFLNLFMLISCDKGGGGVASLWASCLCESGADVVLFSQACF